MTQPQRHRLKVLSLVWFKIYPAVFGGQKGVALFNKYLGQQVELDCLCSRNNMVAPDAGCNIFPELAEGKRGFYDPGNWTRLKRWLHRKKYDAVIVEFPYYAALVWLIKRRSTKLIIHTHNIEAERFRSFGNMGWRLLKMYERWCFRKADMVLFKTTSDRSYAVSQYALPPSKTYLLPYGVERSAGFDKDAAKKTLAQKHGFSPDDKILLFAGTLDYEPNAEAVQLLVEQIEPLLLQKLTAFKIMICGRNESAILPVPLNDNVIYAGLVEDIQSYFAAADCFLNPVQNVHGIQTKILDALNYGLNVVCFAKAAENLPAYLAPKLFAVTEGDYAGFTNAIVPALSATFDTAEAFYEDFSWEANITDFVNHLTASA